jgi:hypothetical protein
MQRHTHGTDPQEGRDLGVSIQCHRNPGLNQGACGIRVSSQQLGCRLGFESERALDR